MCRGCFKWLHIAFLSAWYNQLWETHQTPQNDKSTLHMECLLTDGRAGRSHIFWLWLWGNTVSVLKGILMSAFHRFHIPFQICSLSLWQQPFPYISPVLGRDVPANVPSATAVDVEGSGQQQSAWCASPEHHSLKTLHFFKCISHVIYWFKWKRAATDKLSTHIDSPPWLVLNLSQLASILPTVPLAHTSSPIPSSGTTCSDPAQQLLVS